MLGEGSKEGEGKVGWGGERNWMAVPKKEIMNVTSYCGMDDATLHAT